MRMFYRITFLAILFFGTLSLSQAQRKLPAFQFTSLDGTACTSENLTENSPVIVVFFDPYCDHCAMQADWIHETQESFKDIEVLFVTTEQAEPVKEFKEKHFPDTELDKLHFLLDTEFMFDAYFGYSEVPSIYVYDADWRIRKALKKETSAEDLLLYLQRK